MHSCAPNSGDNAPPRFCRGNKLHCAIERFSPYIHVEIYIYWHFQYRETTFCATYFISSLQSSLPTLLKLIYLRILKKTLSTCLKNLMEYEFISEFMQFEFFKLPNKHYIQVNEDILRRDIRP